jgi:hypothetical protein
MAEEINGYQEEVLADLLDLQAELRGEDPHADARPEPPAAPEVAAERTEVATPPDSVTVSERGLQVSVTPSGAAVSVRMAALNARLSKLERELAAVTRRIEGIDVELADQAEPANVDDSWRTFIDLQRMVADRLDGPR